MKILCNQDDLVTELRIKHLFLDTNTLILALGCNPLLQLLYTLKESSCVLVTLDPVIFQFLRSAEFSSYKKRLDFIEKLGLAILPCDKVSFKQIKPYFHIVTKGMVGKGERKVDFVDYYLVLAMLQFHSSFLITENYHDMPLSILDRKHIITIDTDREIRHQAIYTLNRIKLKKALEEIA